ncbi:MAG: glycosyltransferase [Euryarchaeota archaeon]|nr:glycosyltransferase [Euryarchaeota archaeon]MDE1835630.1 glycosyltransferase [Euryarchaeota archaeon]MDE1878978.1 glycosyltransferase [Euryarchaeota archaeon]MDE2043748.1 glycosyltransferase [Thermoplasmata archaeon]
MHLVGPGARTPNTDLSGGVVACNEERTIRGAIVSLLAQELPRGFAWSDLWVVASGCTDRTVPIVEEIARQDPRVHLVVEHHRQGKSAAIRQVLARARGDRVVLLNGDARAEPGAIAALLRVTTDLAPPFGAMARPVPPQGTGRLFEALSLLWELHHELHLRLLGTARGTHLSDELMLLSTRSLPALPPGTINDGSYLAASISRAGGALRYAPAAKVALSVPGNFRDHLVQRRRILFGHHQVAAAVGLPPSTFPRFARASPGEALRLLFRTTLVRPRGLRSLFFLASIETAAFLFSVGDRLLSRHDHVRWQRVPERIDAYEGLPVCGSGRRETGSPAEPRALPRASATHP